MSLSRLAQWRIWIASQGCLAATAFLLGDVAFGLFLLPFIAVGTVCAVACARRLADAEAMARPCGGCDADAGEECLPHCCRD